MSQSSKTFLHKENTMNTPACHLLKYWRLLNYFLCEHWVHSKHKEAPFTHPSGPSDHEDVCYVCLFEKLE